ncbi:MAG TPA: hypothetical protein VEQ60_08600, partial [Longimicrobium sp.]|nr:hypothetical protein [Longimicrobium sp.]
MSATYAFLPWVRQGAAAAVREPDVPEADLPANALLRVGLELGSGERLQIPLRLYGPGDVTGIDRRQVIRTFPADGADGVPPSLFPLVEFDRPDFPWLFTPARADGDGRLRPWLCLVAVRDREGVTLRRGAGGRPTVLEIRSPADPRAELPDLTESWAWVHGQVVHGAGGMEDALLHHPTRTLSRLLCPRRLEPRTRYRACLVPAFEVGRVAGLGDPPPGESEATRTGPAWRVDDDDDAPGSVILPVYHHWSFTTGDADDFEVEAGRLRPLGPLPTGLGARRLHVANGGIAAIPALTLDFAGVFRTPSFPAPLLPPNPAPPADAARKAWADAIAPLVETAAMDTANVALPLYGARAQALGALPAADGWVRDLNLDPRNRAAAGLGVLFVQLHQEALMQAAWEQLGDAREATSLLRGGELALEVGRSIHIRRFGPMQARAELFFQATSPTHARVLANDGVTVAGWAEAQRLPAPATLAAFRRVARPLGPVARRLRTAAAPAAEPVALREADTGRVTPLSLQPYTATAAQRGSQMEARALDWKQRATDLQAGSRAHAAITALLPDLLRLGAPPPPAPAAPQQFGPMCATLMAQLDPAETVAAALRARILVNG